MNSLVVQWLGLRVFTAMRAGSIPGQGTKFQKPSSMSPHKKEVLFSHYIRIPPSHLTFRLLTHWLYFCLCFENILPALCTSSREALWRYFLFYFINHNSGSFQEVPLPSVSWQQYSSPSTHIYTPLQVYSQV